MIGRSAFRSAWRTRTVRRGRPFDRAVVTYSLPRTSSMLARVYRMSGAAYASPRIDAGMIRWPRRSVMLNGAPSVYRPLTGRTCHDTPSR